ASKQQVKVAGNIGTVATEVAETLSDDEKLVLELSSFQLLGVQAFKPKVAVLLNVYEAHLDYHKTMENYQQAKFNIVARQTENDYFVYNADDPIVTKALSTTNAQKIPFSATSSQPDGAWADDYYIY